jgi:hypothetical protein
MSALPFDGFAWPWLLLALPLPWVVGGGVAPPRPARGGV